MNNRHVAKSVIGDAVRFYNQKRSSTALDSNMTDITYGITDKRKLGKHRAMLTTNYAESGGYLYADRSESSLDIKLTFVR